MRITITEIIKKNGLELTNREKGALADLAKQEYGHLIERVKERHYMVNSYPSELEKDILKLGGYKKKRARIKRVVTPIRE